MAGLKDAAGVSAELASLMQLNRAESERIRELVSMFMNAHTEKKGFGALSAMRLLDFLATQGVQFPPQLLLFRKSVFTLDGVLHDIAGPGTDLDDLLLSAAAKLLPQRWTYIFSLADWMAIQMSWCRFLTRRWTELLSATWLAPMRALCGMPL
jgi:hypothetical protein